MTYRAPIGYKGPSARSTKRVYVAGTKEALFQLHKIRDNWCNCRKCDLCEIRHKVVHIRGMLPCQVFFIGEAPGESENIIGYPFVGDAGDLLNELLFTVHNEMKPLNRTFTYAIANIVGCFPGKDENGNFNRPHKVAVQQCEPHLRSLIELCSPKLLVALGETADKKLPKDLKVTYPYCHLEHPSSINRKKDPREFTLHSKTFTLTLLDAIMEHAR